MSKSTEFCIIAMKSDFVELKVFERIFPYMQAENCLAVSLSLQTGLRIGDVVSLKRAQLNKKTRILQYKAQKTGKNGTCELSREMCERLCKNAGKVYIFEGKAPDKHRTRQAVWADVKKASKRAGIEKNVTPHSARKNYAVNLLRDTESIEEVQRALQHTNVELAEYYAHSDTATRGVLTEYDFERIKRIVEEALRGFLRTERKSSFSPLQGKDIS